MTTVFLDDNELLSFEARQHIMEPVCRWDEWADIELALSRVCVSLSEHTGLARHVRVMLVPEYDVEWFDGDYRPRSGPIEDLIVQLHLGENEYRFVIGTIIALAKYVEGTMAKPKRLLSRLNKPVTYQQMVIENLGQHSRRKIYLRGGPTEAISWDQPATIKGAE